MSSFLPHATRTTSLLQCCGQLTLEDAARPVLLLVNAAGHMFWSFILHGEACITKSTYQRCILCIAIHQDQAEHCSYRGLPVAGSLKTLTIWFTSTEAVEKGSLAPIAHLPNLEHLDLRTVGSECCFEELTSWHSPTIFTSLRSLSLKL